MLLLRSHKNFFVPLSLSKYRLYVTSKNWHQLITEEVEVALPFYKSVSRCVLCCGEPEINIEKFSQTAIYHKTKRMRESKYKRRDECDR